MARNRTCTMAIQLYEEEGEEYGPEYAAFGPGPGANNVEAHIEEGVFYQRRGEGSASVTGHKAAVSCELHSSGPCVRNVGEVCTDIDGALICTPTVESKKPSRGGSANPDHTGPKRPGKHPGIGKKGKRKPSPRRPPGGKNPKGGYNPNQQGNSCEPGNPEYRFCA